MNEHLASFGLLPNIQAELQQTDSQRLIQINTHREGNISARREDADFDARASDPIATLNETAELSTKSNSRLSHSAEWVDSLIVSALSDQSTLAAFSRASPVRQLQPDELLETSGGRAAVMSPIQRALSSHKQSNYLPRFISEGLFDQWVVDMLKGASTGDIQEHLSLLIQFVGNETLEPDLSLEHSDFIEVFGEVMVQRPSIRAVLEERTGNRSEEEVTTIDEFQTLSVSLDLLPQEVDQSLTNRPRLARAVRAVQ